ncbi:MFS transporter [Neobacillus notoginsengisoli]|uniref:MFS transporter n=1 Tax=Neobacillus notoginsengisoli TaxID=1578198 RepID=A0A417YMH8_9BACI|nr:MFS transporter [Neobacillus notoginsengisoli]RHW34851.1 MFS transporter [Neobacillus notoginsengisoli]
MEQAVKRNLFLFVPAKLIAILGSSIYSFAIGLYILNQTGSSLNFAITLLMGSVPRIVLSPLAGTVADRFDRKKIIIVMDFACAIWLGFILFLFTTVTQEIWLLYAATAVLTTFNTFYSTAVTSTVYNMVGPDHLQRAMSLNQSAASLSNILGPMLGGALFGFMPISSFMAINIVAFTISGVFSLFIRYNLYAGQKDDSESTGFFEDLKQGFVYVKNETFIKHLILFAIWLNFWYAAAPIALPYIVLIVRKMPAYQLGVIEGAFSIGTLLIALILSVRPEIKNKERAILGGVTGMSVILILLGFPSLPAVAGIPNSLIFVYLIVLVLINSSLGMVVNMPIFVLLQKKTPDKLRGRVMALLEAGASGMVPIGLILFGVLFEKMPVWFILAVCGFCVLTLVTYHVLKKTFTHHLQEENEDAPPLPARTGA